MREIKFRAWHSKNKEMIYPDIKTDTDSLNLDYITSCLGLLMISNGNPTDSILMQYTGQKDITGKEIYEFDIVEYMAKCNRRDELFRNTIEYYEQCNKTGFFIIAKDRRIRYNLCKDQIYNHKIKVVGNIYEINNER